MPKAKPTHWLIMPPSADQPIWHSAIAEQAKAAGLSLFIGDTAPAGVDLVLTQDAGTAMSAGAQPEDVAVLLSQSGPLSADLSGPEAQTGRHPIVVNSTRMLCRALEIPVDRHFTANQLATGPVKLFEDFSLQIPAAVPSNISRRNRALLAAFAVYEQDEVTWSSDILDFYAPITDRAPNSLTLDATGKPRFIAHGPYITMPAATWNLVVHLDFERQLCGKAFSVHWGGMTEFSSLDLRPDKAGSYKIEMEWCWDKPTPCEFRLMACEGIFDGQITLGDLQLRRVS